MKVLVAGSFKYLTREEACSYAFEKLGCEVIRFAWQKYYGNGLLSKIQQKWLVGPGIIFLNFKLVNVVRKNQPDILYIYRGVPIWPATLKKIHKISKSIIISFNNDNPFGATKDKPLWRHFVPAIHRYDIHFVFRAKNVPEYINCGAKYVRVLMPYYIPSLHNPQILTQEEYKKYGCDIVFIGGAHTQDDRFKIFTRLVNNGINLKIYGEGWGRLTKTNKWLRGYCYPAVWNSEYTKAISADKVAIVLFSRINKDTYTSRNFEIAAIETPMLAEKTDDMLNMFRENKEAVYFSSSEELLEKAVFLIKNDDLRKTIAKNAKKRLGVLGASVNNRMEQVLMTTTEAIDNRIDTGIC